MLVTGIFETSSDGVLECDVDVIAIIRDYVRNWILWLTDSRN